MKTHHEKDDILTGEVVDKRVIRRLMQFVLPQWRLFMLALVLLFVSSAMQLLVPYLFKVGIDNYLATLYYPYNCTSSTLERVEQNIHKPASLVQPRGETIFLRTKAYEQLPHPLRIELDGENEEPPAPVYLFNSTAVSTNNIGYVIGDYWVVKETDLSKIPPQTLTELRGDNIQGIWYVAIAIFIVILLNLITDYGNIIAVQVAGQRAMYHLRTTVFAHLQTLSLSYFDGTPIGKLVTRVTNDVEALNEMFSDVLVNLIKEILLFAGTLVVLFFMNARLAFVALALTPVFIIVAAIFRTKVRDAFRAIRKAIAKLNAVLTEDIAGIKIVHIFGQEKARNSLFNNVSKQCYDAHIRRIVIFGLFRPIVDILTSISIALVLIFGGFNVISGTLTLGALVAFIMYVKRMFGPIIHISQQYNVIQAAVAASERVFGVLDQVPDVPEPDEPAEIPVQTGLVEFDSVSFSYIDGTPVLRNVSFTIEPGKSVAIVGPTGAGKTSIISLICRFYDPDEGAIRLDNCDVRLWPHDLLRRHIALVLQDSFIFSRSVKDNIRLGRKDITDETIIRAAELVQARDFIDALPHKFDEEMMERGSTLSAGQRQLLCFARALAHDPKLLILDEATSNVDPATEVKLQHAVETLMKDRTSLIVAHRLSTIKSCDEILVLDNGHIVERGSHDELMAKRGFYYNLYLIQFSSVDSNG